MVVVTEFPFGVALHGDGHTKPELEPGSGPNGSSGPKGSSGLKGSSGPKGSLGPKGS